tara:strand:- start:2569 stop:2898 length:330 start_codon:yes stop_codon:yes gene_type:complete
MASTITWSVDSHLHDTAGKKFIKQVSYRVSGVDGEFNDSIFNVIKLDRPADSDMQDYSTFLGTGDTVLVEAVKSKLGSEKITEIENAIKENVAKLKAPTETWTAGPTAS